jgi:hypothetical protein
MMKVVVEQNPYDGTWDIGWLDDNLGFTPGECGYATKEEAEAQLPGFDARLEAKLDADMKERDELEREQNERWPNIGYVREKIRAMRNPLKALDAKWRLDALLDMEQHEHVDWPLPSWKAIKSGRARR